MIRKTTLVDIICDGCNDIYYGNDGSLTSCPPAKEVLSNAKADGWVRRLHRNAGYSLDLCPGCQAAGVV